MNFPPIYISFYLGGGSFFLTFYSPGRMRLLLLNKAPQQILSHHWLSSKHLLPNGGVSFRLHYIYFPVQNRSIYFSFFFTATPLINCCLVSKEITHGQIPPISIIVFLPLVNNKWCLFPAAVPLSNHHIYDGEENLSTTPSTVAGGEADQESDTTLALSSGPMTIPHSCSSKNMVTWKTVLSPSTESSSSNMYNER